jgi:hypothetical protein
MSEVSPGNYTGRTIVDFFDVLSGDSIDYTGRTIWVDCTEITRTKKLIITENAQSGYIWTCSDSEGLGAWTPVSGVITGATATASNIGGGEGLFSSKVLNDLEFKTLTSTGNTINISSTGDTVNFEINERSYRATSVSGSVLTTDWTVDVTTTGDTTQTLPSAVGITGKVFNIKNSDVTSTSTVTLATTGSELIDSTYGNGTDLTFKFPVTITVQSTGSGWIII